MALGAYELPRQLPAHLSALTREYEGQGLRFGSATSGRDGHRVLMGAVQMRRSHFHCRSTAVIIIDENNIIVHTWGGHLNGSQHKECHLDITKEYILSTGQDIVYFAILCHACNIILYVSDPTNYYHSTYT